MTKTDKSLVEPMKWYHYIAAFFAGVFLTNAIPHFVNGISGNAFPSPFSNPPGQGLSSPLTNVLWALFNLLVGYLLFRVSKINSKSKLGLFVFFVGMILISIMCSITFMDKAKWIILKSDLKPANNTPSAGPVTNKIKRSTGQKTAKVEVVAYHSRLEDWKSDIFQPKVKPWKGSALGKPNN